MTPESQTRSEEMQTKAEFPERFLSKVNKNGPVPVHVPQLGPCWQWTAGVFKNGYAQYSVNSKARKASRYIFEQVNGPLSSSLCVLHKCDNPRCVRPDHLFSGTHQDNVRDRESKGRGKNGETNKTHCKYGHLLSGENLRIYTDPKGDTSRVCLACKKRNDAARYEN